MGYQIVDPTTYPGWDELVRSHPDSSIFHSADWARALIDTYGFAPQYFVSAENGRIVAAIPMMEVKNFLSGVRGVSLPFTDHCDPILPESAGLKNVVHQVSEFGRNRGWKSFELRTKREIPEEMSPCYRYFHHVLDLQKDEKRMRGLFRKNMQRNIHKAEKGDVKIHVSNTKDSLEKYYRLHCLSRRDHGLPPQPLSLFRNIHRHLLEKEFGIVVLGSHEGEDIAGGVYLHWADRAYFKYGASDKRYLKLRANNLVMWEAIRWYAAKGFKSFSFGRTEMENEGLRKYKLGWGSREDTIKKVIYDIKNDKYLINKNLVYGLHNKFFHYLPVGISRFIGRVVYKFMG